MTTGRAMFDAYMKAVGVADPDKSWLYMSEKGKRSWRLAERAMTIHVIGELRKRASKHEIN